MFHRVLLATALLAAPVVAQPAAHPTERRFDVGRFDAVDLAGSDMVRIVPGPGFRVVAAGDPRAVAALAITVRGTTLVVDRRPGNWRDRGATVTVTMPVLNAATISGSGGLRAEGVAGRRFVARLSGSGGMTLAGIRADTARFDLSGSGSITAIGTARDLAIDLGGSGRVDTRALGVVVLVADLGGSGSIAATASRTATVRAGGSGSVRIGGTPRCDVRKSGTASVRCG